MIVIHEGYIEDDSDSATLLTDIEIDGKIRCVKISVGAEYGKFLSPERADYALIGMLYYALKNKHDVICKAPVTNELLYNIREILLPTLVKSDPKNYAVKIHADMAPPLDKLMFTKSHRGGVGTGLSCGVDSFHSVVKYLDSGYPLQNLTHITVFDIGSFHNLYESIPRVKAVTFQRATNVVAELGLPLIKLESDFQYVFPQDNLYVHTYRDTMAIYAMQKLWRVYYYASGFFYGMFNLSGNLDLDPGYFDLLLLNCFSTSSLRIISEGGEGTRNDKIKFIADNSIVQKNLHVCIKMEINCGVCEKCLRTLLALDALNKLDNFREVFNIDEYNRNRVNAYLFLYRQHVLLHNKFYAETYQILYERHRKFFDSIVVHNN